MSHINTSDVSYYSELMIVPPDLLKIKEWISPHTYKDNTMYML